MITIVYGHPYGRSFNHAILETVIGSLQAKGREYTLLDLYADNFDPAVREGDLALYARGHTRDELAVKYMKILAGTREIIYIFPIWWGLEPAIVKGFHDKVLLKDFAWKYTASGDLSPLLHIKKTTLISTSEAPGTLFRAYFEDYLPNHVFRAVGMENPSWHNLDNVVQGGEQRRKDFLALVAKLI